MITLTLYYWVIFIQPNVMHSLLNFGKDPLNIANSTKIVIINAMSPNWQLTLSHNELTVTNMTGLR